MSKCSRLAEIAVYSQTKSLEWCSWTFLRIVAFALRQKEEYLRRSILQAPKAHDHVERSSCSSLRDFRTGRLGL